MGLFYEQSEVINRTSKVLHVRFDGQDVELQPNYSADGKLLTDVHNMIPSVTVPYAKSQNVLMGSEDPLDPSEFQVLVGVKAKKGTPQRDDISFCEQSAEPTRVPLSDYLDDANLKVVPGRMPGARRTEATAPNGQAPFDVRARG